MYSKALGDKKNNKFMILNQDSIPVFSFSETYKRIMEHDHSIVNIKPNSFNIDGRDRRYQQLKNFFDRDDIIQTAQQSVLLRKHVQMFVDEQEQIIKTFQPDPINFPLRYPSEIIIGTTLKQKGLLDEVINRCIQYEDLSTGNENQIGLVGFNHILDAQQNCLFLGRISNDCLVDSKAKLIIQGKDIEAGRRKLLQNLEL
ncbi:core-2 i-branching beta--n-acetylglucosaminyltransferase family protein [Stylonychia lemnae]|uniref:Core-2 i-branching beta--n-acetylglucosaminyltransferase family protein n=1 Tax=Stylonychia lemnae TaxID=5949 RepID=A0A078ADH4_STYLE|nr:core-2 i-branching beta--n-acetylglucosaminyltransferase family protein [Stylonychia lemnae]CDW78908.1 core-2 i-branching beta--n-acetylglucosaminyltransferase family protein [Stylonychia lemnae]|eukprot:CDW78375.1 core-2 i-branching beta--n-acetylglucosaminyltransferase family protein [Stylonychia lemnae]